MDWREIQPIINSTESTIQEKFTAEQKYWSDAAPVLVGPLKPYELNNLLTTAIDNIINPNDPSISMLDFGCGTGRIYTSLLPKCQYTGVDISESYINIFKSQFYDINLIHIDTPDLPFDNEIFDIIIAYSVFTHIPPGAQCTKTLSELYRVLKPKRPMLISVFLDVTPSPTCNWCTYTTEYWKDVISQFNLTERRVTMCYECAPNIHQHLYTLIK